MVVLSGLSDRRKIVFLGASAVKYAETLRALLAKPELVVAPGVYDGLTARLAAQAGFPAVYMTGAGTAAARGFPDFGLLTMTEMVENAGVIARSASVPANRQRTHSLTTYWI